MKHGFKKLALLGFGFCFMICVNTFNPKAATKEIEIPITKTYTDATFSVECTSVGNYTGVLVDPDGTEYLFTTIDNDSLSCNVPKVKEGTWVAKITDETKDTLTTMKLTVTTSSELTTNTVDDITVAKDIAGLKVYLKNNYLMVEWTDDTCGSLSFKIVNQDTSETLANDKSTEKFYSCEIPSDVQNIHVEITPSRSNNISGTSLAYDFCMTDKPNAEVVYPEFEYTNNDEVNVDVTLYDTYGIVVEVNGLVALEDSSKTSGTYVYAVPLAEEGENNVSVYIVDETGNMSSFDKAFYKDIVAPTIELEKEYDGFETQESIFQLNGKITNYDNFTINGNEVSVASDGYFSFETQLHVGENTFLLSASDKASNVAEYSISVWYSIPEQSINVKPIILLLLIVIILVLGFIYIKKYKIPKTNTNLEKGNNMKLNLDIKEGINISKVKLPKRKIKEIENEYEEYEEYEEVEDEEVTEKTPKKLENKAISLDLGKEVNKLKSLSDRKKHFLKKFVYYVLLVIVVFLFTRFVVIIGRVPSESMYPTFQVNDYVLYNALAYKNEKPQRTDIITFKKDGEYYSKRVIGIEGDVVSFVDGYVYINGVKFEEPYISEDVETNCLSTFTVPSDSVFVLGDNRENSFDSRYWEEPFVDIKDIQGKEFFIIPFHYIFSK